MKADILRRAEAASYEDDEEEDKEGGRDVAYDDDLDENSGIKVRDGEASDDDTDGEDGGAEDQPVCISPSVIMSECLHRRYIQAAPTAVETILELAYIADPKVFDRDAQTRRSKERTDLKARTGAYIELQEVALTMY